MNNKITLSSAQVNAARVVIGKVIPDLKCIELTSDPENPIKVDHTVTLRPDEAYLRMVRLMTPEVRVQKHRAKLKAGQCGRLEVWVPNGLIEAVYAIVRHQKRYMWAVVKEALTAHVTRHAAILTAPHGK